ncbi:hypothetical protein JQC72_13745 [Polycladomyces sp. WAk]|uniref:Uncharacterized protein n=1 Tax=Polycladomyces zharkentensis TaxID=2807616 RepID=A0ABS2WM21_9BACL|nr:hypothetical protein [Polycladomyces sp. WAk]MBN2910565.1 hypothetical protein [Polycladomyces sp. WAk]
MSEPNYRQYQFNLPSCDLDEDFLGDLAKELGLPFDPDDFYDRWLQRDQNHAWLIRDKEKDPNTFILIVFYKDFEFDDLVIRFRDEYTEIVENIIRKMWEKGDISSYPSGINGPRFNNVIDQSEKDWVPRVTKKFGLDIEPLSF